jgi:lysophospholipase L1-like esterase
MTQSATQTPVRWHRILALMVLGFAVCELLAQAAIYGWSGERFHSLSPYRWSAYGLVRNNPELTSPRFKISAHGFRSLRDYSLEKPPKTLRVLMLGGSVLYSGLGGAILAEDVERVDSGSTMAQYLEEDLKQDPELEGINVEVINAGVNFNRIVEVTSAYLAEWVHWKPDVVIVCGSANNFGWTPTRGSIHTRQFSIQAPHNWGLEFERICNGKKLSSLLEYGLLTASEHSAFAALVRKCLILGVDYAFAFPDKVSRRLRLEVAPQEVVGTPADRDECEEYVQEYLGYADALVAAARRRGQEPVFFWEYFLCHLKGIKPFSQAEERIYKGSVRTATPDDKAFDFFGRDSVRSFCSEKGVPFVDPLELLRREPSTVFIDPLHYNRNGNRIMADLMYSQLKNRFHDQARAIRAGVEPGSPHQ